MKIGRTTKIHLTFNDFIEAVSGSKTKKQTIGVIYFFGQLVIHLVDPAMLVCPAVDQMRGALVLSEL